MLVDWCEAILSGLQLNSRLLRLRTLELLSHVEKKIQKQGSSICVNAPILNSFTCTDHKLYQTESEQQHPSLADYQYDSRLNARHLKT